MKDKKMKLRVALLTITTIMGYVLALVWGIWCYNEQYFVELFNITHRLHYEVTSILFVILALDGVAILLLLCWPTEADKNKPLTFKIKSDDFIKKTKQQLKKQYEIHDYYLYEFKSRVYNKYDQTPCNVEYFIHRDKKYQTIVAFIDVDEMLYPLFREYNKFCLIDFGNFIIDNKYINPKKTFYFIPIIIVKNKNEFFEKYITQYPDQASNGYLAPVGIYKTEKKIYVIDQKEGFGLFVHRKIKKAIIEWIDKYNPKKDEQ